MKAKPGIEIRHARECKSRGGARCNCKPSARAWVYDARAKQKIRSRWFSGKGAIAAAQAWRVDNAAAKQRGTLPTSAPQTLREAAEAWLGGAETGTILSRSDAPYKPSALRGYRADLERYVLPELGHIRLSDVRRRDLRDLVESLRLRGLSGSKVRNVVNPVRGDLPASARRGERQQQPDERSCASRARRPTRASGVRARGPRAHRGPA